MERVCKPGSSLGTGIRRPRAWSEKALCVGSLSRKLEPLGRRQATVEITTREMKPRSPAHHFPLQQHMRNSLAVLTSGKLTFFLLAGSLPPAPGRPQGSRSTVFLTPISNRTFRQEIYILWSDEIVAPSWGNVSVPFKWPDVLPWMPGKFIMANPCPWQPLYLMHFATLLLSLWLKPPPS